MRRFQFKWLCPFLLIILTISCSSAGRNWSRLDRFQQNQLLLLDKNIDLKSKVSASQAVIDSIQLFLQDCRDSTYSRQARRVLYAWQQKKNGLEKDFLYQGELHLIDSTEVVGKGTR